MADEFATAINCMDGRVQQPVIDYIKETYKARFVDMITEPGPNHILAEATNQAILHSIRERVEISVYKHGSKRIVIVGHYDCNGNAAAENAQKDHIRKAIETLKGWALPVKVDGLWLDENFEPTPVE